MYLDSALYKWHEFDEREHQTKVWNAYHVEKNHGTNKKYKRSPTNGHFTNGHYLTNDY